MENLEEEKINERVENEKLPTFPVGCLGGRREIWNDEEMKSKHYK
jgi:hypothetical protein